MEFNPWAELEAMRPAPKPPKPEPVKRTVAPGEMNRRRRRGKNGEREVVGLFKRSGWPEAFRTPGSGAWRPYGAADTSPFPLDVASGWPSDWPFDGRSPMAGPWMVEVKFDERMVKPGRSGLLGEAFVRMTLKKVDQQWRQYVDVPGTRHVQPALFARASNSPWRVFVPQTTLMDWLACGTTVEPLEWLEVPQDTFWELAPFVAHRL